MNWTELQEQARKIVESVPEGSYQDKEFVVGTGGAPRNHADIEILHQNLERKYRTVRNGTAIRAETTVRCRDTGTKDNDGRPIYQDENGTVFVWSYRPGDAGSFDRGVFRSPEM